MAIFDFTKFLNTVFNLKPNSFSSSSFSHRHSENISCSSVFPEPDYFQVAHAFWMLSRRYNFSFVDGGITYSLGNCRVVSIVVNEIGLPELLLKDSDDAEHGFFAINQLLIS